MYIQFFFPVIIYIFFDNYIFLLPLKWLLVKLSFSRNVLNPITSVNTCADTKRVIGTLVKPNPHDSCT